MMFVYIISLIPKQKMQICTNYPYMEQHYGILSAYGPQIPVRFLPFYLLFSLVCILCESSYIHR